MFHVEHFHVLSVEHSDVLNLEWIHGEQGARSPYSPLLEVFVHDDKLTLVMQQEDFESSKLWLS